MKKNFAQLLKGEYYATPQGPRLSEDQFIKVLRKMPPASKRKLYRRVRQFLRESPLAADVDYMSGAGIVVHILGPKGGPTVRLLRRPYTEIEKSLRRMTDTTRHKHVREAMRLLQRTAFAADSEVKFGAIYLLQSQLPETIGNIRELLMDFSRPLSYSVTFTLINIIGPEEVPAASRNEYLSLLEEYLLNVPSSVGSAAWLAGYLLGDEWFGNPNSLPVLIHCARSARCVAGRKAAAGGLEYVINTDKRAEDEKKKALTVLRSMARTDRSSKLRRSCRITLRSLRET